MMASLKIRLLVLALLLTTFACASTSGSNAWNDPELSPPVLPLSHDDSIQAAPDPLELPKIEGEDFHRECGDPNCLLHQSPALEALPPSQAELLSLDRDLNEDWELAWQFPEDPDPPNQYAPVEAEAPPRSLWQRIDWADVGKYTAVTVLVGAAITVDVMLIVSSEGKSGAPCTELVLTILKG